MGKRINLYFFLADFLKISDKMYNTFRMETHLLLYVVKAPYESFSLDQGDSNWCCFEEPAQKWDGLLDPG